MKRAIFPGSFDPITNGHYEIIKKGLKLFDEIIIAVGINNQKKYMFSIEKRLEFIESCFEKEKKIKICSYGGLTTDLCKDHGIKFILRGLRNSEDFNFENSLASMNKEMSNVETIFILSSSNTSHINSSLVRDIILNNGDYSKFIPHQIKF